MTSSTSSSSSRRWPAALLVATALAACGHRQRPAGEAPRVAIFPVQNATGGAAPIRRFTDAIETVLSQKLAAAGMEVVLRSEVDAALARERLRYTGGLDRPTAKVLRDELGVNAVLIPTLEVYSKQAPPKIALAVREVSTGERPVVLWADAVSRSGDDAPGLFNLGVISDPQELEDRVVGGVARLVERYVSRKTDGDPCAEAGKFVPRRTFRAPELDDLGRTTVAVLPFINETSRRGAGDVVREQFVAALSRSGTFAVLDPGLVRGELLSHHMVMEAGVSLDQATALVDELDADLVVSGYVQVYEATAGRGAPRIEFSAYVIDGRTAELVWSSTSHGDGDQGVWFFGAGRVRDAGTLSCRMVRGVVDGIVGRRGPLDPDQLSRPQSMRQARRGRSSRVPWYGGTIRNSE
jgi:TolB-like protein